MYVYPWDRIVWTDHRSTCQPRRMREGFTPAPRGAVSRVCAVNCARWLSCKTWPDMEWSLSRSARHANVCLLHGRSKTEAGTCSVGSQTRPSYPCPALFLPHPSTPKKAGTASIFARLTKQIQVYEIENWWGMTAEGFAKQSVGRVFWFSRDFWSFINF